MFFRSLYNLWSPVNYWFIRKGHNSGIARWKQCMGQGVGEKCRARMLSWVHHKPLSVHQPGRFHRCSFIEIKESTWIILLNNFLRKKFFYLILIVLYFFLVVLVLWVISKIPGKLYFLERFIVCVLKRSGQYIYFFSKWVFWLMESKIGVLIIATAHYLSSFSEVLVTDETGDTRF